MTYLIKKIKFIFLITFFLNLISGVFAYENRIIYKINNEIITSFDITREFRYLSLINPKVTNLEKKEIFEISKNSIIREKIKKIEILKHVNEIKLDENYINELINQNYTKLGIDNIYDFEIKLNKIGFDLSEFEEKLSIEALWNRLIYEKYFSKVKINKKKLREQIVSQKKQSLFNLSEIIFNIENKENYKEKLEIIKNEINTKGFENAALIYSISDSKSLGGDLGWIEENIINKNLRGVIKNLKIGEFTEPQVIPGGFLILKLKDIKEENISMNIEDELKKLIILKTNQQLNQFSNIYFNKVKKDIKIEKI
tara:strand:- start:22 stop:957 length:936 start_codon:yes stop_codon:yes gene_type:complete